MLNDDLMIQSLDKLINMPTCFSPEIIMVLTLIRNRFKQLVDESENNSEE